MGSSVQKLWIHYNFGGMQPMFLLTLRLVLHSEPSLTDSNESLLGLLVTAWRLQASCHLPVCVCVGVCEIEGMQHGSPFCAGPRNPRSSSLCLLATGLFIVEIPSSDFKWRSGQPLQKNLTIRAMNMKSLARIPQTDNDKLEIACYNLFDRQA